ncbi:MAG: hypothetical protein EXR72_14875 [Myxococcales bacterium]|nr:hypothetical protein [Myxococcales bacterium]
MSILADVLKDTFGKFVDLTEAAGPKLLAGLMILLMGWLIAKLVAGGLTRVLKMVRLDVAAEKAGVDSFLRRGNVKIGSIELLSRFVYWLLLLLTLLATVNVMGIAEAELIFRSVVSIIPRVILGMVIFILGLGFAGFIGDAVQTGAANAQIRAARLLANIARYATTVLVLIVALNQLQIATEVLSNAFLILFGALCFGLALAFGLGCRDLAGRIAGEAWERERAQAKALEKEASE